MPASRIHSLSVALLFISVGSDVVLRCLMPSLLLPPLPLFKLLLLLTIGLHVGLRCPVPSFCDVIYGILALFEEIYYLLLCIEVFGG